MKAPREGGAPPGEGREPRELDASKLRPQGRRRAILEAFDKLARGESLVLRFHRHPLPLVFFLSEDRFGKFTGQFLERGPAWRVLITRI
jgi:uncharacterized protein (DUF2249 family)